MSTLRSYFSLEHTLDWNTRVVHTLHLLWYHSYRQLIFYFCCYIYRQAFTYVQCDHDFMEGSKHPVAIEIFGPEMFCQVDEVSRPPN